MESPKLDKLALKFWEGQSTSSEEQQLRALLSKEVPAKHQDLADYLQALEEDKMIELKDDGFDEAILQQIKSQTVRPLFLPRLYRFAAAIVLLMALTFGLRNMTDTPTEVADTEFVDTYDDAKVAYAEVRKALMRVSHTMNDGMQPAAALGEFHKVQEELKTN